jgi:putative ABC transport system permease protein
MSFQHARRSLIRTPGFSALVILTLALGIGATTTMFSAVWAVLLRPLPFPNQERLVTIWQRAPRTADEWQRVTPANFVDWAAQTSVFEALGALPNWTGEAWPFNVVGPNGTERVKGIYASSGFFRVLGIAPLIGQTFDDGDDRLQGRRRVVVSHAYWTTRFGSDPSIVGRTLDVDTFRGGAFTIIGVMPSGFDFPQGASFWLSLADWGGGPMPAQDAAERCCPWYASFGLLKPNVTRDRARSEIAAVAERVAARHPDGGPPAEIRVVPLRETLVGDHEPVLFGLFGAVACILLIGCANVANLLLSRGVGRRREVLTRLALGATRWHLARQLLAESLILGGCGAALGILISMWAQRFLAAALTERIPLIDETHFDWIVTGFAVALTLSVSTICGLMPLVDWGAVDWNGRGQTESPRSRRIRHALVVGEIAVAVAVVASAGLLVRTVANLRAVNVGFDTGRTLMVATDLTTSSLRARGSSAQFVQTVIPRLAALPGVRAVAATTGVPLEGGPAGQAITRFGDPVRPAASSPQVVQGAVTPDYFRAMGIAVTRGRVFTEDDRSDGNLVAVLNETAARRYWPGEDSIGKRFAVGSSERFGSFRRPPPGGVEWREIVGVVADVRSAGFAAAVQPEVYFSYRQSPLYDPTLVVRTGGNPDALIQAVRNEIAAVNNSAVITRVRTLDDVADESIADPRLRAALATLFSALALMLGMLGIYGLMSYTVAQRTREIGLRVALGARHGQLARMMMAKAVRLAVAGVAIGLVAAYFVARSISSLFFGVGPADALTLGSACLLLVGAAAAASAYPTLQALRIEPMVALRNE